MPIAARGGQDVLLCPAPNRSVGSIGVRRRASLLYEAIALWLGGKAVGTDTVRRKQAVLHAVLEYVVELEEISAIPLHRVKWKPPKTLKR